MAIKEWLQLEEAEWHKYLTKVELDELKQPSSRTAWAEVWIEFGEIIFPEKKWSDLIFTTLIQWTGLFTDFMKKKEERSGFKSL